jgi:hypothetical protein
VSYDRLVDRIKRLELAVGQDSTNTIPWFAEEINNNIVDLKALQLNDM